LLQRYWVCYLKTGYDKKRKIYRYKKKFSGFLQNRFIANNILKFYFYKMFYINQRIYKLIIALLFFGSVAAQAPPDTLIELKGAIQLAEQRYHLLIAGKYEADAALKSTDAVKYSRLPTIDATYQAGIATANNLTGMFYPNGILPISGPPSASNN